METSLIEQFLYPKFGPGQLWQIVAEKIEEKGGQIIYNEEARKFSFTDGKINSLETYNHETKETKTYTGDHYFSTMPVNHLINGLGKDVPGEIVEIANKLEYRDFSTYVISEPRADVWIRACAPAVAVASLYATERS